MHIENELLRAGGIARTRFLVDAGATPSQITRAVHDGRVERPAKGWIALPDTDPLLRRAAMAGVVLSCVTAAKRHGLWDVGAPQVHVAVAPNGKPRATTTARVHWFQPLIPRQPGALVDPIENTLAIVAECQPHEEALTIWESAIRREAIALDTMRTLPLGPKARRILDEARPFADEGTETILFNRLKWLRLPLRRQVWLLGHRVDLLVGDRLVIQVDGGHHVDAQRTSDNAHDARLRLAGYHPIRITYWQLMHEWHVVQDLILGAIARGLHLAA